MRRRGWPYDTLREQREDSIDLWWCNKLGKSVTVPPDQWPPEWREQDMAGVYRNVIGTKLLRWGFPEA